MSARAIDLARGKWRGVLAQLGIPAVILDGKHHPCPATGEGDDRFRFADRNGSGNYFCCDSDGRRGGIGLLMHVRGWSYAEAATEVEKIVGGVSEQPEKPRRDPRIALNRIRERLVPAGVPVARYLKARGLKLAPGLRQSRLRYWEGSASLGDFDCMVGLLRTADGKPESFHVTYLDGADKASVPCPRKVMTPVNTITGASIRLYPAAPRMGVAEGIETAIAAHMLTGVPVWAAATAHGVETFNPPAICRELVVFGDTDESYAGQAASYVLARRMVRQGIACEVQLPPVGDWNDELKRRVA